MRSFLLLVLFLCPVVPARGAQPAPSAVEPGDSAYYYLLGRRLESVGKIEEAVKAHQQAIALDPGSAELRAELAGLYARQDNAVDAVANAEAALARDASNQDAHRILGTVYAEFGQRRLPVRAGDDPATYPARAIAALEKARGDGFDVGLDFMLGRLYVQTGAFDKAVPLLEGVVESQPTLVDAAIVLSTAQEGAGQQADAIATLERVLGENPGSFRAQLRLAEIYEQDEQWNEAADALAKAQRLNPRASDDRQASRGRLAVGGAGRRVARSVAGDDRLPARQTRRIRFCSTCSPRASASSRTCLRRRPRRRSSSRPIPTTFGGCTCCRSSSRTRVTTRAQSGRSGT